MRLHDQCLKGAAIRGRRGADLQSARENPRYTGPQVSSRELGSLRRLSAGGEERWGKFHCITALTNAWAAKFLQPNLMQMVC